MSQAELPFCIIKFGKKDRLESLLNKGELFFSKTENFNNTKKLNNERTDDNEGAEWIENLYISEVKVNHPKLGEIKFNPAPNSLFKFTQFDHNYLICSFFIITTKDFEESDILEIDKKVLELGDHALIIKNPKKFLDSVTQALDYENIDYQINKVEYKELKTDGRIEMNPFIKKIEHQHQKEFRIIIKNQLDSKLIRINKIGENGTIVTSKYIVESKWEVNRK